MSDFTDGPMMHRAIVAELPQETEYGNVKFKVICRTLRKREVNVYINKINPQKKAVLMLSKGDELYTSADGREITNITFNPWWLRLWLRMVW